MEISGVALQPHISNSGAKQKSDPSAEIQKLEQQKKLIEQQLTQLDRSKQGADAIRNAKDKLQKQMKEIEQQIQALRQQGASEIPSTEEGAKSRAPRFDEYAKNQKETSMAGLYSVGQDGNGNPFIVFDNPMRETETNREKPNSTK